MADETVELKAKLSLDTTDAERSLSQLGGKAGDKSISVNLPKDATVDVPNSAMSSLSAVMTGPKGLKAMGRLMQGVSTGLTGAMNSIRGITSMITSPKVAGIITLIIALISMLIKLMAKTDTWKAMKDALQRLMDVFSETLSKNIALIGDSIILLLDAISALLKPILKVAAALFNFSVRPLLYISRLVEKLAKLIGGILEPIAEIITFLIDLSMAPLDALLDLLTMVLDLLDPLVQILKLVAKAIKMFFDMIKNFIKTLTLGIIDFEYDTSTTGEKEESGVKSSLDTWETSSGDALTAASEDLADSVDTWDDLGKAFSDAVGQWPKIVEGWFADMWDNCVEGWNKVCDWFKKGWDGFCGFCRDAWNWISNVAKSAWDGIKNFAVNVWNGIKGVATTCWNGIKDFAVNVWNGIKNVASTCWDWIKQAGINCWNWITDVAERAWENIVNFFKNLWSGVKDTASNIVSGGSGEGFGGGLFNDTGRWGDGYQPGDVVGSVGDFLGGLVGKGWLWADGGTLDVGAQIWGMNEPGNPEFMFNAGGHDSVINKEILADAVYTAMTRANGKDGKLQLEVSVKAGTPAGPKELVQMLLPSLKFALKS